MLARIAQALLGAIASGGAGGEQQPLGLQMPQPSHQTKNPLHNVHHVHQALLLQQQMALLAQQTHAQQQLPPLTQMLELNTLLNTMREGGGCGGVGAGAAAAPGPSAALGNHLFAAFRAKAEGTATGAQWQKSRTAFPKSAGLSAAAGCESERAASKSQAGIKEEAEGGGRGIGEAGDLQQASSDAKMGQGQGGGGARAAGLQEMAGHVVRVAGDEDGLRSTWTWLVGLRNLAARIAGFRRCFFFEGVGGQETRIISSMQQRYKYISTLIVKMSIQSLVLV